MSNKFKVKFKTFIIFWINEQNQKFNVMVCLRHLRRNNNKVCSFREWKSEREREGLSLCIWEGALIKDFLSVNRNMIWEILQTGPHPYSYGRAFYFTVEEIAGTKTSNMKYKCKWRIRMRYPPQKNNECTQLKDPKVTPHRGYSDIPDNLHKHQHTVERTRRVTPEI